MPPVPPSPALDLDRLNGLINSDFVTPPTRAVLQTRLDEAAKNADAPFMPQFFNEVEWETLLAVCDCALPPVPGLTTAYLASAIDDRLMQKKGDGWRYDALPPDGEAYKTGLRGLNQSVQATKQAADFAALPSDKQADLLRACQNDTIVGDAWKTLPASRFWEELLAELVEVFYSHPLAQASIGYEGFADAKGWKRFGLNVVERPLPDGLVAPTLTTQAGGPLPPAPSPPREGGASRAEDGADTVQEDGQAVTLAEKEPIQAPPSLGGEGAGGRGLDLVDAVVIGTGAGGAPLLARLARAGLKVVALEAGKAWNPAADFATDERAQQKLFWSDERLSSGHNPVAFGSNNSGVGVGGSTLHYTAYTPRPQQDDFHLYSEFGVGANWPIPFAELEPYFGEVETFLGVSGPNPYPWTSPRSFGYPLPPLPLNGAALLMERACKTLGIRTSPAPNAALSKKYYQEGVGWRPACTNRGFCQAGCSVRAKASMDVTFLPVAVRYGAEIRPECFVTKIERDNAGAVKGVVYEQNGREVRQECKSVFLCAGAVETPRLLLLNDMGNGSGQVGRNFMAHPGMQVWGQFDEAVFPYKAIPGGLISEDTHRPKDADFAGGYLLQSIGVMPVTYVSQMARGTGIFGDDLRDHMAGYNHVAGINILGDGLPYDGNYLELSDEKDARGFPKPRIFHTAGDNEKKMNAHAEKLMRQIWDTAGAKNVWSFERYAHTIGTCRMGNSASNSVVNADGAVWDVPGLTICDNSVFPSALSVNPALTIMALSLRTADRFLQKAGR